MTESNSGTGSPRLSLPSGMAVLYGAAPEPFLPISPDPWPTTETTTKIDVRSKVDPPPPYAADAEIAVLDAISRLDEVTRRRVLRYAVARWLDTVSAPPRANPARDTEDPVDPQEDPLA